MYISYNNIYNPDPNAPEYYTGQVVKFIGSDIDDAWTGHNEDQSHWALITPDFSSASYVTTPIGADKIAQIWFPSIVASDWENDKLWLAVYYVPDNPQIKVLLYQNGIWTNQSTGIPIDEAPISLVYEQGSNDMVYLGTNRAVYYWDGTAQSWYPYTTSLPQTLVNQMQINYTENTLRAATYGNGVWKTSLKCPSNYDITKSGTTSSNDFEEAEHNITAQNLIISSGSVKYRAGNEIALLPGFGVSAAAGIDFFAYIHGCNTTGNSYFKTAAGNTSNTDSPEQTLEKIKDIISESIRIYPNPSSGVYTLDLGYTYPCSIQVFDAMGKLVREKNSARESKITLDLTSETPGVYLIKIIADDKIKTQRLIKE
jgi:hypothetical protein